MELKACTQYTLYGFNTIADALKKNPMETREAVTRGQEEGSLLLKKDWNMRNTILSKVIWKRRLNSI